MTSKIINFVALSLALMFAACGDDNSSATEQNVSDSEDISVSVNEVSGVSQKGPFLMGSKVQMFEISNGRSLNQTGKSFNGKISNDKGEFKIKGSKLVSQYVTLEASGYYRNEITGNNSKSELTLLAISNVSDRNTININLLTHLEYERVIYLVTQQKMKVDEAKKQAQREIFQIFGIDNTKFSNSEDLNIAGTNDDDGALLAISVLLQGDRNESQLSELLTKIAIDMEEDGEWNDDAQKNAIAEWAAEIVHSGRITSIRSNVEKWQLSNIVPNFEKYINNFWWHNYGLGECSVERNGVVLPNTNTQSAKYGTYYICDAQGWRTATTYEKDTFGWKDSTDGAIKKGNVTDTTYLFDRTAWRTRTDVEQKLGGCVNAIVDSVGKVGNTYYICKLNNWVEASVIEYDTYRWSAGKDGEIKKGNVTGNVYIFDKNAWRIADYLEAILGGCVSATQDSLGKVDDSYYICKSNKWKIASVAIYDTLKMVCSKNGSLMHGKIEHENLYVCDKGVFRTADSIEIALDSGCTSYNEGSISRKSKITDYICKSSRWVQLIDSIKYDGQIYHIVRIGNQTWFADNLNYADSLSTLDLKGNSWCYDDDVQNCKKHGRLYTWTAAMNIAKEYQRKYYKPKEPNRGICPSGWHIPSKKEIETLYNNVGGPQNLMVTDLSDYWNISTNPYLFSMPPSGWRPFGVYENIDRQGYLWTSTESSTEYAYQMRVYEPGGGDVADYYKEVGYSVRCVKDLESSSSVTNVKPGACTSAIEDSVRKIDENIYVCASNKWVEMTATQYDTYKEKCSEFGQITHGQVNVDYTYFCNGKEWKRFYGNENITYGKLEDERDGQIYRTVEIGGQIWMAENLNYADSSKTPSLKGKTRCDDMNKLKCDGNERLYTWGAAIDSVALAKDKNNPQSCGFGKVCVLSGKIQGVCPSGWHLPSNQEWNVLFEVVGGESTAGKFLKSASGWYGLSGTDDYGFTVLPRGNGEANADFWTSTISSAGTRAYFKDFPYQNLNVNAWDDFMDREFGVRCIKDGSVSNMTEYDTYSQKCTEFGQIIHGNHNTDNVYFCNGKEWKRFYGNENITYGKLEDERDGQIYRTVEIGNQTWMAENLNYYDKTNLSLKGKSWCYDNDSLKCSEYGRLYTWAAAIDSVAIAADKNNPQNCGYGKKCDFSEKIQGICPNAWHLPNNDEWNKLFSAVGGESTAGIALKSQNKWEYHYGCIGSDSYGFSAFPASRKNDGRYDGEYNTYFWSTTESPNGIAAYAMNLYADHEYAILVDADSKNSGFSVRCIKNE